MITNNRRHLTDNAWIDRVNELRQMVDDYFDPKLATPYDWACDYCQHSEGEYDVDDAAQLFAFADRRAVKELTQ